MIEQTITTNVIIASYGCKLTQAADVAIQDRIVTDKVYLSKTSSSEDWKEITEDAAALIRTQQQFGNFKKQ